METAFTTLSLILAGITILHGVLVPPKQGRK